MCAQRSNRRVRKRTRSRHRAVLHALASKTVGILLAYANVGMLVATISVGQTHPG